MANGFNLEEFLSGPWGMPSMLGLEGLLNIPSWISQASAASEQAKLREILTNPAKFAAFVQGMPSSLTPDLVNSVTSATKADLAQRGLSDAPGFTAKSIAGALAPFEAQDLANRRSTALGALTGAPPSPSFPGFDIGGLAKMMQSIITLREMLSKFSFRSGATTGSGSGFTASPAGFAATLGKPGEFSIPMPSLLEVSPDIEALGG